MSDKRVVHLIQSLGNGGCENMLLRTLPSLNREGFDNIVITLKEEGELATRFRDHGVTVITIGQKKLWDVHAYIRIVQTIKSQKPDVITTYLFHADAIGRLLLQFFFRVPVIPFLRTTYNHTAYRFARLFEYLTKCFVPQYVANSEAVKDFYVRQFRISSNKITVIPNGIDISQYADTSCSKSLSRDLRIPDDHIVITCVANLTENKGHQYLLRSFEKIYTQYSKVVLLLAGDGGERKRLIRQIEKYSSRQNIKFLGCRADIPNILALTDIFVLSTLFEGMSNALIEAMAARKAIITTDLPENRELLRHEESALLVAPRNVKAIVESVLVLIHDPVCRKRLALAAYITAQRNFSIDTTVHKLSCFYNELR